MTRLIVFLGVCEGGYFCRCNFHDYTMTKEEAEIILKVNDQASRDKFDQLEAKAKQLRQRFDECFKKGDTRGLMEVNKELQKVNNEMNRVRTNAANIRAAMVDLNQATPRELQRTIKMINDELNSGRVKRGSEEWDHYIAKLKETQAELRKVRNEMDGIEDGEGFLEKIKNGINDWGASAAAATAAFAGVIMSGKAAVQAYSELEAEQKNVIKFTGMTADEVARLNDEFDRMNTRTSKIQLNQLAQEAGRLGKSSVEDVMGFVKAADKINVALDDLGQGATLTLSKLTGIFGDETIYGTEQSLLKVGSVINELSQNCSAAAPYLAEFSSRLGGIAAQSNMTISQIMAFGAVLDTQNLQVEASATAVGQLITKIYKAPAEMAKAAGLDVKKFSDMVKTDMNGALVMLFEHLKQFGGMEQLASVFDEMGTDGARAIPVLAALAGHIDELKSQQAEANKAFREGTSVTKEFEVQNNTVEAGLEKSRKGFQQAAVALGEELLPVMSHCISGSSMLMRTLLVLVQFFIKYRTQIVMLAAGVAAYTIAIKANTIATAANAAAHKAWALGASTIKAAYKLCAAAVYLLTGNVTKAKLAWQAFNLAIKASPLGLAVSVITMAVTALGTWIYKNNQAAKEERRLAQERKKAALEWRKSLTDTSAIEEQLSAKELARLKQLYTAATNVHASQKKRISAAKELQATYPNTFSGLKTEEILAGKASAAYLALAKNIREVAKAQAARQKMQENFELQITLELENDSLADDIDEKEKQLDALHKRIRGLQSAAAGSTKKARELKAAREAELLLLNELEQLDMRRAENIDKANEAQKVNNKLMKIAESTVKAIEESKTGEDKPDITLPETDAQRKEREKKEREAAKKARESLKKELDERKSLYLQEDAQLQVQYYTGLIDYKEFTDKRKDLERQYVADVVKIHEDHNRLDVVAYGKALQEKADLETKTLDEKKKKERTSSLTEIEKDHSASKRSIEEDYYNPSSEVYQNKKVLDQRLLEEELLYLTLKKSLYEEDSKEYIELQKRTEERVADDRLSKQRETAEALMAFEQEYRKGSGSRREQMELAVLDSLHDQGLISEKEYQKAVADIKDRYRNEDREKAMTVQSEYADMLLNLTDSFSKFFNDLGDEGSDFWGNLSKAATAAFTVMSAILSQYSAYASAARDAEVSKIEQRYEREIKAAGKNKKKTEKLEKQKEAEIAKVKKKHNDKAMKIEIAQAVASTALAAINAYASGSKDNVWLGPIAAAMATAAGMEQIATIKKQHEAQAAGYYDGGFTTRDPDHRKVVGEVHANEFVANHQAVANPALAPVLRLIDHAQRTNTVGSLSTTDVSRALGQSPGVGPGGDNRAAADPEDYLNALALMTSVASSTHASIDRLNSNLESGIIADVIMDGERGLHKKLERYNKLLDNPKK